MSTVRITGIGGTGVVTLSQVLATAASFDGLSARTVDMTGLAQKGGAVVGDLKISARPIELAAKVASGTCDLYLACDALVGSDPVNLKVAAPERTTAVVATTRIPTGAMVIDTSVGFPSDAQIHDAIDGRMARTVYLDPGELSTALLGHEQYANMLAVGAAYQTGSLPITAASIERAISTNGVAVEANIAAFRWGRQMIVDPGAVTAEIARRHPGTATPEPSSEAREQVRAMGVLDEDLTHTIALRVDELVAYADRRYAADYLDVLDRVVRSGIGITVLDAVARHLYKLMAYKDEYEVARLTADAGFAAQIADEFGPDAKVAIRLHPPTLRSMGMKNKMSLGRWAKPGMSTLARMKKLRGTPLDPFGRTEIRRTERALVVEYRDLVDAILTAWSDGTVGDAQVPALTELAALPDMIRGYEGIKMANVERYHAELVTRRAALEI